MTPESSAGVPFVSVVIPVRNEHAFIARTLDRMLAQDYPADRMEIIVADGMSDDGTREIVRRYADRRPRIRLIDNPERVTPSGLNAGDRRGAWRRHFPDRRALRGVH